MSFERFIEKWTHEDYPPETVSASGLDAVEARFDFVLPRDYRQAVQTRGLPRPTVALLNSIVAAELNLADVSDFFAPGEIVKMTEDWRGAGLPDHLVAFADDCMGNLFCFDGAPDADHGAVWFWDHDDGSAVSVADSFATWIERFCSVAFVEDDFAP